MRNAVVLYNPTAGRGRAAAASERACRALTQHGLEVERRPTTGPFSATALAREAVGSLDLLVVAGGDGSVREALVGLGSAASRIPVGIVPCGNANVVARELGIPLSPEAAVEVLVQGVSTQIDVGHVDREMFLAMVGIGFDARTTRNLAALRRTRFGRAWYRAFADSAYAACGLAASLAWRPDRLRIEVDGHPVSRNYCAALVANTATYGKGWSLVPHAAIDDGRLDYQARKRFGFPFLLCQLLAGMLRKPAPAFLSDYGSGERISITADRPFPVHVDGDFRGSRDSIDLCVSPRAARILVPSEPPRVTAVQRIRGL